MGKQSNKRTVTGQMTFAFIVFLNGAIEFSVFLKIFLFLPSGNKISNDPSIHIPNQFVVVGKESN